MLGFVPVTLGFLLQPLWAAGGGGEAGADGTAPGAPRCVGFRHTTRRMWVCGVPVPRFLSLTADGITTVVDAGLRRPTNPLRLG